MAFLYFRKQHKKLGSNAKGTRVESTSSLNHDSSRNSTEDLDADLVTLCDAILVTSVEVGDEQQMVADARDAFHNAADSEELHVKNFNGDLVVVDHRGMNLRELASRVSSLEMEVASLRERDQDKSMISSLQDQLDSLKNSHDPYIALRHRFISVFKRDKLQVSDKEDKRVIQEGNSFAHGGDAITDASLYTGPNCRKDVSVYKRLYGIDPMRVASVCHKETIEVLNMHARIAAARYKRGTPALYAQFETFITHLEDSEYDEKYLEGPATALTQAYNAFLQEALDVLEDVPQGAGSELIDSELRSSDQ